MLATRSSKPFAGRCKASWVGSIPIHPANFSGVMTQAAPESMETVTDFLTLAKRRLAGGGNALDSPLRRLAWSTRA
jgi:hypothetical protein